ncbi:hypothetical protein D8674_028709 [Pyrus ussuriensis x Pyrus communis]|uniref:Uncharacterized protein n=1 Tax=Pyrus ussuriensis x Pyrus communis TaxID=2448454 RepID=A0A5N5I235_9ROSA|nr:hypothetical protein D8674_028709 [Pyrus ussuriensis x Pyrus communis]
MAVVALIKLKVVTMSTSHSIAVLTGLIWPFVLKLSFSFRLVHQTSSEIIHAWRLFFFQLNQIAAVDLDDDANHHHRQPATRLQRTLRLLQRTVTQERQSEALELDEQSIHALTMVAL